MTLYITEKPSQVKALKSALEANNIKDFMIVPLVGHIMELKNPIEYEGGLTKDWIDDYENKRLPFIPNPFQKKIKRKLYDVYKKVKEGILKADKIIVASDPDNEGVVLVLEVLENLNAVDKVIGMINMSKLDLNSLKKEVKILDKIPYKFMNKAGNARAYADWIIGMSGTVAATVLLGNELGGVVHIGGVKLPILRMVVDRDYEFENFKNIPYWTIKGDIEKEGKSIQVSFKFNDNERFDNENEAKKILEEIEKGYIKTVKESKKETKPGQPFSLTNLQSESSKKFNLTSSQTLEKAQKLYDSKYQSYPRTDSNYYSDGEFLDAENIIKELKKYNDKYEKVVNLIKFPLKKRECFNDKKVSAHTALAPTAELPKKFSDDKERGVWELVSQRYLIQFMENYKYIQRVIEGKTNVEGLDFKATSNQTESLGFKELDYILYDKKDENKENLMPNFKENDEVEFKNLRLERGETKPKPRFTESSLLLGMEKISTLFDDEEVKKHLKDGGIGTPATRGAILKELFEKEYLKLDKKKIISTQKTRDLIKYLPEKLTSPVLRAELESYIKDIIKGEKDENFVINYMKDFMKESIEYMENYVKDNGIKIKKKVVYENTGIKCPKCSNEILEGENFFKCEKTGNFDSKTKKWTGDCDFTFIKKNKLIGKTFDKKMLEEFINGKEIEFEKGVLKFDLNSNFFSKVEWKNKENYDFHRFEFDSKGRTYKGFKDKCEEGKENERKIIFMPFLGKDFTEEEAKKLFEGKTITKKELKGKSKKTFDAKLKLVKKGDNWQFDMSF